jgi:3',5'-cyclic AMP phosphodiesterase CpdA
VADSTTTGTLLAVSDLHASYRANREIIRDLNPTSDADWLIVAGDLGELVEHIEWTLRTLSSRFAKVIWAPGNHELWTHQKDSVQLRGERRYRHLVELCRSIDVTTPEDPYPVWTGYGGPVAIAPLFVLYDYSFLPPAAQTKAQALEQAYGRGVVCTDEYLLHPDPYPDLESWCAARVAETETRLAGLPAELPTVLVNHYPLVRDPTDVLHFPEFALWCGTTRTADWHLRFRAACVVYGHLHIPRTTYHDGVPFHEVSLGYPREWGKYQHQHSLPRAILPIRTRK